MHFTGRYSNCSSARVARDAKHDGEHSGYGFVTFRTKCVSAFPLLIAPVVATAVVACYQRRERDAPTRPLLAPSLGSLSAAVLALVGAGRTRRRRSTTRGRTSPGARCASAGRRATRRTPTSTAAARPPAAATRPPCRSRANQWRRSRRSQSLGGTERRRADVGGSELGGPRPRPMGRRWLVTRISRHWLENRSRSASALDTVLGSGRLAPTLVRRCAFAHRISEHCLTAAMPSTPVPQHLPASVRTPHSDHPSRTVGHTVRPHCQLYELWGVWFFATAGPTRAT